LSARILVWNAMPSMTAMISLIFWLDSRISSIVATKLVIFAPPAAASSAVCCAMRLASDALARLLLEASVIWNIECAHAWIMPACFSVRDARS